MEVFGSPIFSSPTEELDVPVVQPTAAPKPTGPTMSASERVRLRMLEQQKVFRGYAIPIALTLGVTLPLLAGGWFLLPQYTVVRQLPIYVPLAILASGLIFAAMAAYFIVAERKATPGPSVAA